MIDKNDFLKKVGKQLQKIRKEKGLSLRELELRGDIDRHVISRIENGQLNPTIYTLKKIAIVLDVNLDELLKNT